MRRRVMGGKPFTGGTLEITYEDHGNNLYILFNNEDRGYPPLRLEVVPGDQISIRNNFSINMWVEVDGERFTLGCGRSHHVTIIDHLPTIHTGGTFSLGCP